MNNKEFYTKYNYPKLKKWNKKHRSLINKILSYSKTEIKDLENKKVLVAGCGTGEKALYFASKGADVTAFDISLGQLEKTKEKANKMDINIKLLKANILDPKIQELEKFDYVFCIGVLHHTKNGKTGFENISKLLKKNGKITIALYHKYARIKYRIIRRLIRIFVSKNPNKIIIFLFSKNPFAKLINNASKETIYDRYAVPFESYHTLKEVRKWFSQEKIKEIKHSDNVSGFEPLKIFEKKTLFFVSGKKD